MLAVVPALAPLLMASRADDPGLAVDAKLSQAEAGLAVSVTCCCSGTGKSFLGSGYGCYWTGTPGSVSEFIWLAGLYTGTIGGSYLSLSSRFS